MFFSITKDILDNFPCHIDFGFEYLNLDEGWHYTKIGNVQIAYKGYLDDGRLEDHLGEIVEQDIPKFMGNFCVIVKQNKTISIKTDIYRSFPIYYDNNQITNLTKLENSIAIDKLISIKDYQLDIRKIQLIDSLESETIDFDTAVNRIDGILNAKVEKFLKSNTLPLKVFLTGGLDTLLIYSYIKKYTSNFELLNYMHFELDEFWLKNSDIITENWAYKQLHHWREPTVLACGTPGDEFMLRNPDTGNAMLSHYNTSVPELLANPAYANCFHYTYFKSKTFKTAAFKNKQLLLLNLMLSTYNDFQHWHLGNTLTWTPLRDPDIFKTVLSLDRESTIQQVMDGAITKTLIKRNDAQLINAQGKQKNRLNPMRNLVGFIL
jgi:hypothetical protein